jgi:hypothetical protein
VADLLGKTGAAGTQAWTEIREPPSAAIPLLQADAARDGNTVIFIKKNTVIFKSGL